MSKVPLTTKEKNQRKSDIAMMDRIELEGLRKNQLQDLARDCFPFSKLTKPELIEALIAFAAPAIAKQNAMAAEALANNDEDIFSADALVKAYQNEADAATHGAYLGRYNLKNFSDISAAKKKLGRLKHLLAGLKAKNMVSKEWADECFKGYSKQTRDKRKEINIEDKEKVANRESEDLVLVKTDEILDFAKRTLESWVNNDDDYRKKKGLWHRVSMALMATSGRRGCEIHGHCQFEVVDENHVKAVGLAKKPVDDYEFIFKTIVVDAQTWVKCRYLLPEHALNVDPLLFDDKTRGNISSKARKTLWKSWGLEKYYTHRSFYICYRLDREYQRAQHVSENRFVMSIVGHDSEKSVVHYTKLLTLPPESYDSETREIALKNRKTVAAGGKISRKKNKTTTSKVTDMEESKTKATTAKDGVNGIKIPYPNDGKIETNPTKSLVGKQYGQAIVTDQAPDYVRSNGKRNPAYFYLIIGDSEKKATTVAGLKKLANH
ncbi:MAG: hypothetical protein AAFO95_19575 [Cyanobacteria bacterium J06600_6]